MLQKYGKIKKMKEIPESNYNWNNIFVPFNSIALQAHKREIAGGKNMKTLLEKAIRVTPEMVEVSSDTKQESNLEIVKFITGLRSKAYAKKNGVTAIVYSGQLYVTPFDIIEELEKRNFTKEYFYVPFSEGTVPLDLEQRNTWKELCEKSYTV